MSGQEFRELILGIAKRHKEIDELKFIREAPDGFTVSSLTGGSSNHVLRVTSQDGQHNLVFKHAPDEAKSFETMAITPIRVHIDCFAQRFFNEATPGSVPKEYCLDTESHTFVMEYLDGMETLTDQLNRGLVDLEVARIIGETTGRLHVYTWCSRMAEDERNKLIDQFNVAELIKIKRDFDFTEALSEDYVCNKIDDENLSYFRELKKDGFLDSHMKQLDDYFYSTKQCLVHNDLHTSSVLVKDNSLKVFDMEFSGIGIGAIDIGVLLSYYGMAYYKASSEKDKDLSLLLLDGMKVIADAYVKTMASVTTDKAEERKMVQDIADFTGYSLLRSTLFAEVDIHIPTSPAVKATCWRYGRTLMEGAHGVQDIDSFMKLLTVV